MTHEIGHWLGLRHISGDPLPSENGCLVDDFCADTPTATSNAFGCPLGFISCSEPEPIENYMNFTDDDCTTNFTQCQADRMRIVMGETGMGSPRREILASSTACQIAGDFDMVALQPSYGACQPDNIIVELRVQLADNFSGQVDLSINNLPQGLNATFSANPVSQSGIYTITLSGTSSVAVGAYDLIIQGDEVGGTFVRSTSVQVAVKDNITSTANLLSPADGSSNQSRIPVLMWSALLDADAYDVEVATDINFNTIVDSESDIEDTSFRVTVLAPTTLYYWRVRAKNICSTGAWSSPFSFTTSTEETTTGTCNFPLILECGMTYIGDLANGEDNIDGYSQFLGDTSDAYVGPEQIYELVITEPSIVTITLSDFENDLDIYVLENCNDPIGTRIRNTIGNRDVESITDRFSRGTYTISIDGRNGTTSEYVLSVECEPICETLTGFVEDFEDGQPSAWTFTVSGSGNSSTKRWMFNNGGFGIMSQIDNPGTFNWAYYDDYGNGPNGRNNVATATSPTIDLSDQENIRLSFDYAFVETPIVDGETVRLSITDGANTFYWTGLSWASSVNNWLDDFTIFTADGFLDISIPNNLNNSNLSITLQYNDGGDPNDEAEGFGFDNFSLCGESTSTMPTCNDGIQNGLETGVDCGGPDCPPCMMEPTCDDGIQNGLETGVDCGGPDCPPCMMMACDAPTGLFETNNTGTSITLNWIVVPDANTYTVQGREQGTTPWLLTTTSSTNSATISNNIVNGVTYEWRVRSNCDDGETSPFSEIASFTAGEMPTCMDDIMVNENPIDAGTYSANNTVMSTGRVATGTMVEFTAGQSITLKDGFHAEDNSTFTARIAPCPTTAQSAIVEGRTLEIADQIQVFPNPMSTQSTIAISISETKNLSIDLHDMTGRTVRSILANRSMEAGQHQFILNVNDLNSGIYFLVVRMDDKIQTQKLSLIK